MQLGFELLGEVDRIDDMGSIKTRFLTFMFIPFFPECSYFVFSKTEQPNKTLFLGLGWINSSNYQAIEVPLNYRSVIKGYFQRFNLFFMVIWGIKTISDPNDSNILQSVSISVEILSIIFFLSFFFVKKADEIRKNHIISLLHNKEKKKSRTDAIDREEPTAQLETIESALKSDDSTDRAWAINEIKTLPATLANELRRKYNIEDQEF